VELDPEQFMAPLKSSKPEASKFKKKHDKECADPLELSSFKVSVLLGFEV
jgi:hypothetical protein